MTVLDSQGEGMLLTYSHRGNMWYHTSPRLRGFWKENHFSDAEFCLCSMNLVFHPTEEKVSSSAGSLWTLLLEDRIPCQITEIVSHFTLYTFKHTVHYQHKMHEKFSCSKKVCLNKKVLFYWISVATEKHKLLEA